MGVYVVVGASLLGVFSCMLVVWSLWTRSQARKRARARMQAQHAGPSASYPIVQPTGSHTVVAMPPGPPVRDEEPRTQLMTSEQLFGQVPEEPTQFLSDEELFGAQAREPATTVLSDAELFGEDDDEEAEVVTTFMTTDELFAGRAAAPPSDPTMVLQQPAPAPVRPTAPRHLPSPKAATPPRYTGFVGDRADDRDDDDDDFNEDDPETELVHQAELLRLIGQSKRSE